MCSDFSKELIDEKNRQRLAMRNEYLKQMTNPYKQGEGGHIFDAGVQRFLSMKVTQIDHFRETPTTIKRGLLFVIIPLSLTIYILKKHRDENEAAYRAGKVAYKDRLFKFQ